MTKKSFISDVRYVYAAGDLHGDYDSFRDILRIYEKNRNEALLIFLGDYADRGAFGLEIISELNALLDTGETVVALMGNHELYNNGLPSFYPCNLLREAEEKYGSWDNFYHDVMTGFLSKLHRAAVINNVLFIHAGISSEIKTLEDLSDPEYERLMLWSDPSSAHGEHPNQRGEGVTFGEDVTQEVLASLGLSMIVRGHEPGKASYGPYAEHGGKVVTVNSSSYYGDPFILRIDTIGLHYEPVFLLRENISSETDSDERG